MLLNGNMLIKHVKFSNRSNVFSRKYVQNVAVFAYVALTANVVIVNKLLREKRVQPFMCRTICRIRRH